MFKDFHVFSQEGENYLFQIDKYKIFRISQSIADFINNLKYSHNNKEDINSEEWQILEKMDLLRTSDNNFQELKIPSNYPLKSLTLNISQNCNLNCIYCYGGDGDYGNSGLMSEEVAFKSVDWLFSESQNIKTYSIVFFGGEPLLNVPLMKKVVDYAKSIAKAKNKEILFSITTNGTLLDKDIIDYLTENNFAIVVSFDGDKEIQNKNRPFKNGTGSYEVILKNVKQLLKARKGRVTARATITSHNTDIAIVRKKLYEIGFSKVNVVLASKPVLKKSSLNLFTQLTESERSEVYKDIAKETSEFEYYLIHKDRRVQDTQIFDIIHTILKRLKKPYPCGMARAMYTIDINGDVYPCHRFVGIKETILGNVSNKSINRFKYLKQLNVLSNETCKFCWLRFICAGGCFMNNYTETNDMFSPDKNHCELYKAKVENAIHQIGKLTKSDKIFISNL